MSVDLPSSTLPQVRTREGGSRASEIALPLFPFHRRALLLKSIRRPARSEIFVVRISATISSMTGSGKSTTAPPTTGNIPASESVPIAAPAFRQD